MSEIVRTPTKVGGGITDTEKIELKKHADMWISRILSTKKADFNKLEEAIHGLYRVSNLKKPEVILVKSPIMMVFMYGTCAILTENKDTDVATILKNVANDMNNIPINTKPETHYVNVCKSLTGIDGINIAKNWTSVYQGGAYWAQYDTYLTAMRDVLRLRLKEHENYKYWEEAAIHGTFRIMHDKFCIVSDFPEVLNVDDTNRAHGQDGPSHRWRDGWSLYHWHGVSVPEHWITKSKELTAKEAITWVNIEQRRCACEILGWNIILKELNAVVIDSDGDPEIGELIEVDLADIGKEKFLRVLCGTKREFVIPVPPDMKTAMMAQSWTFGLDLKDFVIPEIRT